MKENKDNHSDFPHPDAGKSGLGASQLISIDEGWRQETLQLRKNREEECAQVQAFVELFEKALPDAKAGKKTAGLPLVCLALHHLAMRFHSHAGPTAIKIMHAARLDDLPDCYGDFGPSLDLDDREEKNC